MKICLVLMASLVVVASGHKTDGGSYSGKKADKLSLKESLINKIHNIKDKIHAKIATKKEKIHAKKARKHGDLTGILEKGAQPAVDCSTVLDEVWEEQCDTKYEPVCRMEMQPHCTSIQAKECAPESQTRCSFVFEDKCKTISVPKCTIDWEKRCTSTPDCTTIEAKTCTEVEKDVCVTHMDKICTMSTVNVCRKVAIREFTPEDDAVERVGLKASFKAKAAAHKAHKAQIKAEKLASKGDRAYTPVVDTDRAGLKASIKAKAAAHKALKKEIIAEKLASKAHGIFKRSAGNEPGNEPENEPGNEPENEGVAKDHHQIHKRQAPSGFINPETGKEFFVCSDGKKIPKVYQCNAYSDCSDGSDEQDCEEIEKGKPKWFYCRNGEAKDPKDLNYPNRIPYAQFCDKIDNDCFDHSDEDRISCPIDSKTEDPDEGRVKHWNDRCLVALQNGDRCESDNIEFINRLKAEKYANDVDLDKYEANMSPRAWSHLTDFRFRISGLLDKLRDDCRQAVRGKALCAGDELSQRWYRMFKKEDADQELEFHIDAYNFAQVEKKHRGLDSSPLLDNIRTRRAAEDDSEALEEAIEEAIAGQHEAIDLAWAEELPLNRNQRSLKGDDSGDHKGRLETFKAGLKAAKDQYHQAKAQFKATTKALIHAKLNKGTKGDTGLKASVPTIRVRYEKSCQDEPRKICTQTPRQDCHKEVVPLCKTEPRETCVEKEKCKSWPKKNCAMVQKETCFPFPTKKCTEISTPVCRVVPRQECTEKKHEICETVPTKDCQKVLVSKPRTVCIPRPTSRTIEDW